MKIAVDQENRNTVMSKKTAFQRKSCYRDLISKVENINESGDVGLQTVKDLHSVLEEVNQLEDEYHISERVKQVDETLIDSVVLASASSILVKCIESVDSFNSTYEAREFAAKTRETLQVDGDEFTVRHWLSLLPDARSLINEVPNYAFTYGGLDATHLPQPKERKQRVRHEKEHVVKKQLQSVANTNKEEEGIDEIVSVLRKVLQDEFVKNGSKPIGYYEYVVDTESFAATVENMFYCSFLIRNGEAMMDVDRDGQPTIKPVPKKELKAFRESKGRNTQMISSISMDEWKELQIDVGFLQRHKNKSKK